MRRWTESFADELRQRHYEGQLALEDVLDPKERGDLLQDMLDPLRRERASSRMPTPRP